MKQTPKISDTQADIIHLLLRAGLAFALLYAAYGGFVNQSLWIGYLPSETLGIARETLLHLWGIGEVILAVWLFSGWRIWYPALISTVGLLAIVGFNFSQLSVLFRDVALAFSAVALVVWHTPQETFKS